MEDFEKKYKEAMKACKELSDSFDNETLTEELEKIFPELKESQDDRLRNALISYVKTNCSIAGGYGKQEILAWLEKQGERMPADKAEPKFKVGDWVVYTGYLLKDSGKEIYVMQVASVEDGRYNFTDTSTLCFDSEKDMRLWTIQDAKAGDVLSYRDGQWCFIYKGIVTEDTFKYYALLSEKGITVNDAAFSLLTSCIIPATKEQRDLLFQKMHEAGYEWDADKKELKKIEQKPAWSEEDKELIDEVIQLIEDGALSREEKDGYIERLNSLKDRVQPQPKQEWSKEDESYLNTTIAYLKDAKEFKKTAENCIDWLKSLRPQNHWKPSEEMLDALYRAIPEETKEKSEDEILLDKLYQGLKYGRVLSKN